jgi:hypothetical protein
MIIFLNLRGRDTRGFRAIEIVLCRYPISVNKSARRIDLLRGQFDITEKLTLLTSNSPIETGEQSPLGVIKRLANSKHPARDNKDLDRLTPTPISEHMTRYSSTTARRREAESSPRTAYSVNHLERGITPDLQAAHCQRK